MVGWILLSLLSVQTYKGLVAQGAEALSAGRLEEAESALVEASRLEPHQVRPKLLLTNLYLDDERPSDALAIIEPLALSVAPADRSPVLSTLYGLSLAQAGRHEDALAPLRDALAAQPRRTRALFNLGRSLQALDRFEEAAEAYEEGFSFPPPENVRFALGYGRCQIRLGKLDIAARHIDALVEKHPDVGRAWLLKGVVAFEQQRYADSVTDIRRAKELGYRLAEADLRLGMALGMLGAFDEAQLALDRALEREPELATAFYYKGLFLFREGELLAPDGANPFGVHAVRLMERSLDLAHNPKASLDLAEVQLRLRLNAQVIETVKDAVDVPELAPRAFHLKAVAHHELLEYEPAEEAYRQAVAAGADGAELYHDWGNLLSVMGRWDEARETLMKALERDPDFTGTLLQLGIVHLNLGAQETALTYLNRVVEREPDQAEAWYQKGVVESREGHTEDAVASWSRALEIDPDQTRLYYRLAAELVKLGRIEERNALLAEFSEREKVAEAEEEQAEQLDNLLGGAIAASDSGDDARAVSLLEQAGRLATDNPLPIVYLSDFYLSRSRFDDAIRVLDGGLARLPDELSLYQALLSVRTAQGDLSGADAARARIRAIITGSE